MLKDIYSLRSPDPYYSGDAGCVGSTLEQLHQDMSKLGLPEYVPESVRRCHDGVRNAYTLLHAHTLSRAVRSGHLRV